MRRVMRWCLRNVILLLIEEWHNAQQERRYMQVVYAFAARCRAERQLFQAALRELEQMQLDALNVSLSAPGAQAAVEQMLLASMHRLAETVKERVIFP